MKNQLEHKSEHRAILGRRNDFELVVRECRKETTVRVLLKLL